MEGEKERKVQKAIKSDFNTCRGEMIYYIHFILDTGLIRFTFFLISWALELQVPVLDILFLFDGDKKTETKGL